jgi:hypothetical protein
MQKQEEIERKQRQLIALMSPKVRERRERRERERREKREKRGEKRAERRERTQRAKISDVSTKPNGRCGNRFHLNFRNLQDGFSLRNPGPSTFRKTFPSFGSLSSDNFGKKLRNRFLDSRKLR